MNKDYKISAGQRTLGRVIVVPVVDLDGIIFENASIPSDVAKPQYNDMSDVGEVGEVCRDQFELLGKSGVQAAAISSGLSGSQPQVVNG